MKRTPNIITLQYLEGLVAEAEKKDLLHNKSLNKEFSNNNNKIDKYNDYWKALNSRCH
jgi:hypothetical protein